MIGIKLCIVLVSLALMQIPVLASNKAIGPEEFSKSFDIKLKPGQAFYEITLNEPVYRNLKRNDQRDLRIVNSAGHSVPADIRRPVSVKKARIVKKNRLLFYPLFGKTGQNLDDLSVHINRNSAGMIVNVDIGNGKNKENGTHPIAYLIDSANFRKPISELQFSWNSANNNGGLIDLKVEYSDDLVRWRTIGGRNVLADLRYKGHRLTKGIVKLNNIEAKYIRLSWPESTSKFSIRSIYAFNITKNHESPAYQWSQLVGQPDPVMPNTFLYDTGGHLSVYRARISSQEKNGAIKVTLQSNDQLVPQTRPDKKRRLLDLSGSRRHLLRRDDRKNRPYWRRHAYRKMMYDIDIDGTRIKSDDIRFARTSNRYWRIQTEPNGDTVTPAPILELGWLPDKILFLATGEPPFQLLVGNEKARFRVNTDPALIRQMRTREIEPTLATLGEFVSLNTDEAEQGGKFGSNPVKNGLLWAVMVFGVLILGWMAFRLSKQINESDKDT